MDLPCSLNDIAAFETLLGIRILVISAAAGNKFVHYGTVEPTGRPHIYLYLVKNKGSSHYHTIASISGFYSSNHFCEACLTPFNNVKDHRCANNCMSCKSTRCPETDASLSCSKCHVTCRSLDCFNRHRKVPAQKRGEKEELSQCRQWWKCTTCKKVVDRNKRNMEETPHQCGEWLCRSCQKWVMDGHLCYLRAEKPTVKDPNVTLILSH